MAKGLTRVIFANISLNLVKSSQAHLVKTVYGLNWSCARGYRCSAARTTARAQHVAEIN